MSAHTPLPWSAELYNEGAFEICAEKVMGGCIVIASRSRHTTRADEMHANAARIVKCVNEHDALLAHNAELEAEKRSAELMYQGMKTLLNEATAHNAELLRLVAKMDAALASIDENCGEYRGHGQLREIADIARAARPARAALSAGRSGGV